MDAASLNCPRVLISLVSHGHGSMVLEALRALAISVQSSSLAVRVLITLNLPEPDLQLAIAEGPWPFEVACVANVQPLGFGANHNQAFALAYETDDRLTWFVVMNPDVFWPQQAGFFWESLVQAPSADVGLLCPVQADVQGARQDFARHLMTPWGLAWRVFRKVLGASPSGVASNVGQADWVNGACMVWRAEAFAAVGGFDERYFMYCEDTDICLRLQLAGWRMQEASVTVIHDARRYTGRSWQHLRWHIASMLRLWFSIAFWKFLYMAISENHRRMQ